MYVEKVKEENIKKTESQIKSRKCDIANLIQRSPMKNSSDILNDVRVQSKAVQEHDIQTHSSDQGANRSVIQRKLKIENAECTIDDVEAIMAEISYSFDESDNPRVRDIIEQMIRATTKYSYGKWWELIDAIKEQMEMPDSEEDFPVQDEQQQQQSSDEDPDVEYSGILHEHPKYHLAGGGGIKKDIIQRITLSRLQELVGRRDNQRHKGNNKKQHNFDFYTGAGGEIIVSNNGSKSSGGGIKTGFKIIFKKSGKWRIEEIEKKA